MLEDVSTLFRDTGIDCEVRIDSNEHTYEVQQASEDNWLYAAFLAFRRLFNSLEEQGRGVESFTSIGTGPGLDAIGAWRIFHPKLTVMTDIHPDVLPLAARNFVSNVGATARFTTLHGNLLEPLLREGMKMDLVYANLPNLPSLDPIAEGKNSASFYAVDTLPSSGAVEAYRLAMQVAVLEQASRVLNSGGSLLLNFGARVPTALLYEKVEECGLKYEELFNGIKRQTQADEVLPGYAEAEKEHEVEFDFYFFPDPSIPRNYLNFAEGTEVLKRVLRPFRVSATQALALHHSGKFIHHVVQVIRAGKV